MDCQSSLDAISLATSFFEAPRVNRDFITRSKDTEASPASILATRDWLDDINFANSIWLRHFLVRIDLTELHNASFIFLTNNHI